MREFLHLKGFQCFSMHALVQHHSLFTILHTRTCDQYDFTVNLFPWYRNNKPVCTLDVAPHNLDNQFEDVERKTHCSAQKIL